MDTGYWCKWTRGARVDGHGVHEQGGLCRRVGRKGTWGRGVKGHRDAVQVDMVRRYTRTLGRGVEGHGKMKTPEDCVTEHCGSEIREKSQGPELMVSSVEWLLTHTITQNEIA